jgi:hypothetical protein
MIPLEQIKSELLARIAELRELEKRSTPGKWYFGKNQMGHITFLLANDENYIGEVYGQEETDLATAALIATARNLFPLALDVMEAHVNDLWHGIASDYDDGAETQAGELRTLHAAICQGKP